MVEKRQAKMVRNIMSVTSYMVTREGFYINGDACALILRALDFYIANLK